MKEAVRVKWELPGAVARGGQQEEKAWGVMELQPAEAPTPPFGHRYGILARHRRRRIFRLSRRPEDMTGRP
jgi:hypothetical protein